MGYQPTSMDVNMDSIERALPFRDWSWSFLLLWPGNQPTNECMSLELSLPRMVDLGVLGPCNLETPSVCSLLPKRRKVEAKESSVPAAWLQSCLSGDDGLSVKLSFLKLKVGDLCWDTWFRHA